MDPLAERTGVVIGGGSGIGRGIALALADEGMHLVIADIERDAALAVAEEVRKKNVRALAVAVDATQPDSLERLAEEAYQEFGAVHLLSNNAGVVPTLGVLEERSDDEWLWVMSVNLHGIVRSVQAFLPRMKAQAGEAHIQNTASMAGITVSAVHGIGIYTASKHACVGYSLSLRNELADAGIGVSVLCPGMVVSNLAATSARNRPGQYGGPLREPGATDPKLLAKMMSAEECGTIVVRGIRENRAYIITHPESLPLVEAHHRQLLADYEAERLAQRTSGLE
jgi:NAD(P)-dependent dehydrogenase (short-subunit alcohol dehydrogenase family)